MPQTHDTLKGGFPMFTTARPETSAQWETRRGELRSTIRRLLGDLPPLFVPKATVLGVEERPGYIVERFSFDNGVGDAVFGRTLIPSDVTGPRPAVLYHHWHAEQYDLGTRELLECVHPDLGFATGEELVRRGYVVQGIDAYGFGERRFQGPAGEREMGASVEAALFKTFLWEGRTLWGMMVRDDMLALNLLASRPQVDLSRIAAMGVSMGSTRTWWLAALDDRIKVAVCVACLTRYQNLIARGSVNAHGIYYYVPNLLKEGIDAESIVGLIAPRPLLTLTGDRDEGSPADGVRIVNAFLEHLYRSYDRPDDFRGLHYPGVGHAYKPDM
ncbi:MAG: acetylxylan esterase, partial [Phycisphaerales bacterium]